MRALDPMPVTCLIFLVRPAPLRVALHRHLLPLSSSSSPAAMAGNPVAAFVIGLGIVLLASVLNAGGLNLTKLDHVRCADIPPAARRSEWLRPLWVLGMLLYM